MIRFDEISGSDEITISPTLDTSFAEMSKPEAYSLGVDELLSEVFQDMSDPRSSSPLSAHEEIPEGVEIKLIRMKVIRGQDEFVKFLGMNFTMMPDGVFRLSSVKVCQRLNSPGSRVVLHGSMLGTMLYEVIFRHLPQCNYYRNRMNIASI
eukprot:gene9566-10385_t